MNFTFFVTAIMLGVGLAMDAFSVSLVAGLNEPGMKKRRISVVSGVFAFFQALMPLIGWVCVHTLLEYFKGIQRFIPLIAFLLLSYIGGKMIIEGWRDRNEESCPLIRLTFSSLIIQGIATSIDALSVGFKIAEYTLIEAVVSALVISAVTFLICFVGVLIGKKTGTLLSGKAGILGGVILVIIGLQMLIDSFI